MKSKRIIVVLGLVCILALVASIPSTLAKNPKGNDGWLEVGGYLDITAIISPGSGDLPVPGGKIRGFSVIMQSAAYTTGPAAEFLNGLGGSFVMNANLDENMTGPFWGTFEFSKVTSKGEYTWAGTCNGQWNWVLNAGNNKCEGTIKGPGIKHGVAMNDSVWPGDPTMSRGYTFGRVFGLPKD